jgi:predicted ATPase/DNA-binding SARP family transcriptional activator
MSDEVLPALLVPRSAEAASGLEIRLFGPMAVRIGSLPLPRLRTRKGLWLLALLALRAGRPVERDWLAGTLWPDCNQADSRRSLRQSLHDLRLALGPEAWRLTGESPGTLRLDVCGASVDVLAFDTAVEAPPPGTRGTGMGSPDDFELLAAGVRLYRGPFLEDCTEAWSLEERRRREQTYLAALERLAAAATARGEHQAAASYLRLAVSVDPCQEDRQRALMQALADGGSPAGALLVYRQFCTLLRQEMAAEPSGETTALFRRLRDETRARARPRIPEPRMAAPLRSSPLTPKGNLPQPLSAFVGREREILAVGECLASARLVTLTGTGGIGKTRLAIRVAEECAGEFVAGAWFVDLAALTDMSLVPQAVARVLRVPEASGCPLTETLQEALSTRQLLLVLDNCEHLIDACARLADALLSGCPHLRILATSRQALGLTGEVSWPVAPLSLPPAQGVGSESAPDTLLQYEAVHLLVERAAAAASGFVLDENNAAATVQVCRRLDGIPLAIELAAARLKVLPVEQIAARLDDRFRLLTGGSRSALPRQQTLRATLDWSYELLAEPERVLMRRLSVFAGGWTLEAAEVICADFGFGILDFGLDPTKTSDSPEPLTLPAIPNPKSQIQNDEVLDLLTPLIEKSLVVYEPGETGPRYRMLETVRHYFGERLLEAGEEEAIRGRHGEYFLALAEAAAPHRKGSQWAEWLERLGTEHDNLRTALSWCLSSSHRGEAALRLTTALFGFWTDRGHFNEGRERLAEALASTAGVIPRGPLRAQALETAGRLAIHQADFRAARALHEESLAIQRRSGDQSGIARSLIWLGSISREQGDYAAAGALYEESRAIYRELRDRSGHARSFEGLAMVAYYQGDYGVARAMLEESLAIRRALGDRLAIADSLNDLGAVVYEQADYGAARARHEESLAIRRELGDGQGIAYTLHHLGHMALEQQDYAAARARCEEGLAIRRELGDRSGIADSLYHLGTVVYEQADFDAARARHEESLTIRRELGEHLRIAESLVALAALAGEGQGLPGVGEGTITGERFAAGEAADGARAAARLFGAAAALRDAIGAPVPPRNQAAYVRQTRRAREMLGEAAFAAAWEEGRAMALEEAIRVALGRA